MTEFSDVLDNVVSGADALFEANGIFKDDAKKLFELYQAGEGEKEERAIAIDHLEDAGLIRHRNDICGCGACTPSIRHLSSCAVHNAPAMKPGPCDCGAEEAWRNDRAVNA